MNEGLMTVLEQIADKNHDGHFTVMKFTTNWRVCFGTPEDRADRMSDMEVGATFEEAALKAITKEIRK